MAPSQELNEAQRRQNTYQQNIDRNIARRKRLSAGTASETEYLHSINAKLGSIKGIAIWFLILSILGIVIGILVAANSH
jgi:hypothetical protein